MFEKHCWETQIFQNLLNEQLQSPVITASTVNPTLLPIVQINVTNQHSEDETSAPEDLKDNTTVTSTPVTALIFPQKTEKKFT